MEFLTFSAYWIGFVTLLCVALIAVLFIARITFELSSEIIERIGLKTQDQVMLIHFMAWKAAKKKDNKGLERIDFALDKARRYDSIVSRLRHSVTLLIAAGNKTSTSVSWEEAVTLAQITLETDPSYARRPISKPGEIIKKDDT